MNAWMLHAMADSHRQDMQRDAAQHADRANRLAWRPAPNAPTWPHMRRQVGYALVQAGLRLLATDGPAPRA